jgi:signal transduction histidine kinase
VFAELQRKARQMERLTREMRLLSSRLIASQDEERRRLSREIPECLGRELIAIELTLDIMLGETSVESKGSAGARKGLDSAERAMQQVQQRVSSLAPAVVGGSWVGCIASLILGRPGQTRQHRDFTS